MIYSLTGINTHLDFGFGITAESYYDSADFLYNKRKELGTFQQQEMPMNFLYRHSIELFLKSLIIIFHKKLKLPYGLIAFDSDKPKAFIKNEWKDLYSCHWIDDLFSYWLNEVFLKNKNQILELAPNGDWRIDKEMFELFPLIAQYDRDSSFFRYPITKNANLDASKYTMQPIEVEKLPELLKLDVNATDDNQAKIMMLFTNKEGEIVRGFVKEKNILNHVTEALKDVACKLQNIHIMTRMVLCDKM